MKKLILFLLIMVIPMAIRAQIVTIDGIKYDLNSGKAIVLPTSEGYSGNIEIPETVKYGNTSYIVKAIKDGAFKLCTELKSISIPGTVEKIPYQAFSYCSSLSTVSIGQGVKEIDERAFENCKRIVSINIPFSITTIGNGAFLRCENMVGYFELRCKTIGNSAFYGSGISHIVLSAEVTTIGTSAFSKCQKLKTIELQNSEISETMFEGCTSLEEVLISSNISSISYGAFADCDVLNTVIVDDGNTPLSVGKNVFLNSPIKVFYMGRSLGDLLFNSIPTLESVVIGDKITEIKDNLFYNCNNLKKVAIGNNVTHIGKNAFSNCSLLSDIKLPESIKTIESDAFSGCSSLSSVDLDDNLTSISNAAFQGCKNLGTISIPDKVTFLGLNIFKDCSKLTSITIGAKVERLNSTMFEGCVKLESLKISDGNSSIELDVNLLDESPLNYFYMGRNFKEGSKLSQKKLEKLEIGDLVTTLGYGAFFNCTNLKTIIIGSGVDSFSYPFQGCPNVTEISINNNNLFFDSRDQCDAVINKQTNVLVYGCQKTTIPKSIVKIGNSAFENCSNLTSINIPDGITEIGYGAFANCI